MLLCILLFLDVVEPFDNSNMLLCMIRHPCQLKANLRMEEFTAIKQLKADKERIILTADKGIALVVMDRSDYIRKANELLQDPSTYKTIPSDPTNKLKNKLINKLRKSRMTQAWLTTCTEECTQLEQLYQNSMGTQNSQE